MYPRYMCTTTGTAEPIQSVQGTHAKQTNALGLCSQPVELSLAKAPSAE